MLITHHCIYTSPQQGSIMPASGDSDSLEVHILNMIWGKKNNWIFDFNTFDYRPKMYLWH